MTILFFLRERQDDSPIFQVFRAALAKNILITPGSIFGTDKKFGHHIRLNAGMLWSTTVERALFELGKLAAGV